MQSCKKTSSEIIWVDENTIDLIFMDSSIMKLVYNEPEKYTFNCMNWSYSKGDTFDSVCVILTSKFDGIGRDKFVCPKDAHIIDNGKNTVEQSINEMLAFIENVCYNL